MQYRLVTTPLRILVVEDNRDLRDVIRLQLEFGGYQVKLVRDAEAALAAVHDFMPQVLVVDVALPGMDGAALCRRLRDDTSSPAIPVLIYSAMASTEPRVRAALTLPAVRYQSKGGSTRTLHTALEALLGASGAEVIP
jgi:CheY-like chemotaxis protein